MILLLATQMIEVPRVAAESNTRSQSSATRSGATKSPAVRAAMKKEHDVVKRSHQDDTTDSSAVILRDDRPERADLNEQNKSDSSRW